MLRKGDREPISGPKVAEAQLAAFREWEQFSGKRFADLKTKSKLVNSVKT